MQDTSRAKRRCREDIAAASVSGRLFYEKMPGRVYSQEGKEMYYVPDNTEMCGYYECEECGSRFLDLRVGPMLVCPYCGEQTDMEIGPDEEMPQMVETAKLIRVVRGKEDVEKMDMLLSLALTGGDYNWI